MNAQANTQTKQNNSVVVGGRTYTHVSTDRSFLGRIICTDLAQETHTIVLAVLEVGCGIELVRRCNSSMTTLAGIQFEPIPEVDWTQVEVDTPIWVRTSDKDPWVERHFSKFDPETNTVCAWNDGYTSHTGKWNGSSHWNYATLTDPQAGTKTP